ncbi:outer membrane protein assembly factor BamB [Deefgea piscis]|uniref:outer membrane protein assembly factor BamB n=1 Tax=Deefgea piscis TaxID=2739061 RepID=UPI001C812DD8|nr:outer membrane protein assembly factor BamB [Deefgea piscis]QZA80350.1 outer membrane protein assembly factor BamB [Deefgea piscis]
MKCLRPLLLLSVFSISACSTTSNAPEPAQLPVVTSTANPKIDWKSSVGGKTEYRFQPAFNGELIAAVGGNNELALFERANGKKRWQIKIAQPVAGGVGISGGVIAVGSSNGDVLTYDLSGQAIWSAKVTSEVISAPVVSDDLVIVRSGDGKVSAFSADKGELKWIYQRPQPALLLRNYAPPVVADGVVYVGQAAGRLTAISIADGRVLWEAPVALPRGASELERVTDIVAPPVVRGDMVCAVAFQGRVACLGAKQGNLLWTREISSWTGLAIDSQNVYVTDAKGQINAFERTTGRSIWRQDLLANRLISAPAILAGNILVGDLDGYIHVVNPEDGRFVGQLPTDGGRIYLAPQSDSSQAIVQTGKGSIYLLSTQ